MTTGVTATVASAAFLRCRLARHVDPGVIDHVTRRWASAWLNPADARLSVRGAGNIERGQAYLVACNHQSNLDSMALLRVLADRR
jgi:1-acyl-sn-glycerol-3-phosphate acyltransferase